MQRSQCPYFSFCLSPEAKRIQQNDRPVTQANSDRPPQKHLTQYWVFLRALLPSLSDGIGQATHPPSRASLPDAHLSGRARGFPSKS
ncbi:hypothetical protein [Altericista sp. CCNU0014]|uniref:hypothetical protein n=1 Tax=Altericista sp. CCNU0014 TaxID=3082949 RepID=UPI00384B4E05